MNGSEFFHIDDWSEVSFFFVFVNELEVVRSNLNDSGSTCARRERCVLMNLEREIIYFFRKLRLESISSYFFFLKDIFMRMFVYFNFFFHLLLQLVSHHK